MSNVNYNFQLEEKAKFDKKIREQQIKKLLELTETSALLEELYRRDDIQKFAVARARINVLPGKKIIDVQDPADIYINLR